MVFAVLAVLALSTVAKAAELEIVNEWGVLEWATPSGYPGGYRASKAVPTSFEVTWDRIFVALPRLYAGNPATLGVIPRNRPGRPGPLSPRLQAYPSWEWHQEAAQGRSLRRDNCTGLVSVFRMRIDKCNRLWVLDTGVTDTFEELNVLCPPKILVFDLATDILVKRIVIPSELLRRNSLLTNIVLDEEEGLHGPRRSCDNLVAYLSDSSAAQLLVYDVGRDAVWRLSHPYMYPDPDHGVYRLEGESFTIMDGILGLAVSPPAAGGRRRLFFQPFASDRLFSIETAALRRGPNPGDDSELPVRVEGTKSSQAAGMIFHPGSGALYFAPVSETAVTAWVPGTLQPRVVGYNTELMQFILDFRSPPIDDNTIWFISTKLHRFVTETLDPSKPNIRIVRILERELPYFINETVPYFK